VIETIINAIERAFRRRGHDPHHAALRRGLGNAGRVPWHDNVFIAEDWASRALDEAAEDFEAARMEHQRKKRERR
jgi:hypothetical protein